VNHEHHNYPPPIRDEPALLRQTVVVIGRSSGIGFETARRAHTERPKVILTARETLRQMTHPHESAATRLKM
jgi:NAD(P)-dependent dehydrogenase (short-subunit alcohol dehydrogenase family)